jgi:predicted enzyme related to lactoylglutathione lyase
MTQPLGKFVWFELVSTDAKKAQAFYGEVLGWRVKDVPIGPTPYQMIAVGDHTVGGYTAPQGAGANVPPHWISHLLVDSADAAIGRVKQAGGTVLAGPIKVGELGTMVTIADPLGGALNLWQPANRDGGPAPAPTDGDFVWNELWTADVARSLAFYRAIGGYTVEAMEMGGPEPYHVLASGGERRGGVMKSPKAGVPQMWLPYVRVASADRTVERAGKLGAEIVAAPADIPGVGRYAIFKDTVGAVLGIIQPPSAA